MSDDSKVICPACCHEFVAISVNDQDERARLRAERDALKQDALRYRWLRDPDCDQWSLPSRFSGYELDREIDRAMPLAGKE